MDDEKRQEAEADLAAKKELSSLIGKQKKKASTLQKIQKIINIVTAIVNFITAFWPLIIVVVCAITISAIFTSVIDSDDGSEEDFSSTVQENVSITENQATQEDLEKAIIGTFNLDVENNADLKTKVQENAGKIIIWQTSYGYSAYIFVAIAKVEGIDITGEGFDTFLTEMNEKGARWKEKGYTTIEQIAEDYVGDETSQEWANTVETKMNEIIDKV